MEDCYICYSSLSTDAKHWEKLPCSHKMCKKCFLKLDNFNKEKNIFKCPYCRQDYKKICINVETYNPQVQLQINFEIEIPNLIIPNTRLHINRTRRRRRNLSLEEIKERRENIKKKCKKKWDLKNLRLKKIKWYDIELD